MSLPAPRSRPLPPLEPEAWGARPRSLRRARRRAGLASTFAPRSRRKPPSPRPPGSPKARLPPPTRHRGRSGSGRPNRHHHRHHHPRRRQVRRRPRRRPPLHPRRRRRHHPLHLLHPQAHRHPRLRRRSPHPALRRRTGRELHELDARDAGGAPCGVDAVVPPDHARPHMRASTGPSAVRTTRITSTVQMKPRLSSRYRHLPQELPQLVERQRVDPSVEAALHHSLIIRLHVGQQARRHKVGDGEPGDVHVRPKRAGQQVAEDGLEGLLVGGALGLPPVSARRRRCTPRWHRDRPRLAPLRRAARRPPPAPFVPAPWRRLSTAIAPLRRRARVLPLPSTALQPLLAVPAPPRPVASRVPAASLFLVIRDVILLAVRVVIRVLLVAPPFLIPCAAPSNPLPLLRLPLPRGEIWLEYLCP